MCRRLNGEITRIKQQKVTVQKSMEASAKSFAQWRLQKEKVRGRGGSVKGDGWYSW